MTKARDLANSAAAFASVSATELGYVDGVTSAIQTQMDAKAPSSTAATLTGTQTLTNKTIDTASNTITGAVTLTGTQTLTNKTLTSPALTTPTISTATTNGDILYGTGSGALSRLGIGSTNQALGVTGGVPAYQASSKSTLTTTGDIIYASAANTPARLGIGTTGQSLTVAAGVPSWATASAGALTLIKARTSFSNVASTTTSFDSVFSSTYYNYLIVIDGFTAVTANATLMFQWRSGGTTYAGGNYYSGYNNLTWNGTSAPVGNSGGTYVSIATLAAAGNFAAFTVNYYSTQAADTNAKLAWTGYSPQLQGNVNGSGFVNASTNWDGFILTCSTGNIYTGSVTVYGMAKA